MPSDMTLTLDTLETGEFGNNPAPVDPGVFGAVTDADGVVTAEFTSGATGDLTLNFNAFDVDTAIEIKILINGVLHSFLPVGVNEGLSAHSLTITAAQQVAGTNTISFVQDENVAFKWGVTDVELVTAAGDVDIGTLTIDDVGGPVTQEFGNKFNGTTDADGEITASFTGGTTDLVLNFDGFDIDTGTEVEVFLENTTLGSVSLGKLAAGTNDGLSAYSIAISAAQQTDLEVSTITFKQIDNITFKWGVTNVELVTSAGPPPPDFTLMIDDAGGPVTAEFGNNPVDEPGVFGVVSDADGVVKAEFTSGASGDLTLNFNAFDVDTATEIKVLVNGVLHSFLPVGVNQGLSAHSLTITAGQQVVGTNTISFVQNDNITFKWGVTDVALVTPVGDVDIGTLTIDDVGGPVTQEFGNKFNGTTDADGEITATFTGGTTDLVLNFDGFDIDTGTEVEVFLENTTLGSVSLGKLAAGTNEGLSAYSIAISAAQQTDLEVSTITFKQIDNITYKWGVTNVELVTPAGPPPADMTLTVDAAASTAEFGNNPVDEPGVFGVNSDADGVVTAEFTSGASGDLTLNFNAFDVDTATEIKVLVNGVLHSFLPVGVNQGLSAHSLTITAGQQVVGTNTISFVQNDNITFKWGVTDVALVTPVGDVDIGTLTIDDVGGPVTQEFGNKFNGTTDADGEITATFTGGTTDLVLNFDGFDIDTGTEVEVFLENTTLGSVSLGKLAAGTNEGLSAYSIAISAAQQTDLEVSTITFKQIDNITYKWGVTNVELVTPAGPPPADMTLTVDAAASTAEFGNNPVDEPGVFGVNSDADGVVTAEFTSGASGDLTLNFNAFDVDTATEIKVLVNGVLHSFLPVGVNQGLSAHSLTITAGQQVVGTNTISFVQNDNITFKWGVTDVELVTAAGDVDIGTLTIDDVGGPVTQEFGNKFNGTTDADGEITATFTGGTTDLVLNFDGFDIDTGTEVEVFLENTTLGSVSLGKLAAGTNDGLSAYSIAISAAQQTNLEVSTITFKQIDNITYKWGVTDVALVSQASDQNIGVLVVDGPAVTQEFGNKFNGTTDADGEITASFTGGTTDLVLNFDGFDIDTGTEVEVFLNNGTTTVSLGKLVAGTNEGLSAYSIAITAAQQGNAVTNTIIFKQIDNITYKWGVTNVELVTPPPIFSPSDPLYAQQWHLGEIGALETIWAEYTGAGVSVAVYDDGLQWSHHDLDDNYDETKHVGLGEGEARILLDPADGGSQHGTAVAGVIAAEADGIGSVGVAFEASLTGVNIITGAASSALPDLTNFVEVMMQMSTFDVVNHSWGWEPPFTPDDPPPAVSADFYALTLPTLENAAVNGRGGLGTNLVKSAGNSSASAQGDLLSGSRYTISVGATSDKDIIASYSNHGANLLVTAPSSGEILFDLSILTTDLLGASGFSNNDYTGTDFFTGFGGTSSAAPVVSGVVALMLDANSNLGWRDVQSILAYSATHSGSDIGAVSPGFSESYLWRFNGGENWNGGGLHISEDYGFGDVDAYNAVRMAEVWNLFGTPKTSANEVNFNTSATSIAAPAAGITIDLDMTGASLDIDHVEVSLTLSDASVDVFLVSPDGTRVELYRAADAVGTTVEPFEWTFGAQIFRGEQIDGNWQLDIVNSDLDAAFTVDYSVDWYGSTASADDVYHYTAEMLGLDLELDAGRVSLDDSGGTDWFDFAATAGDIVSDMSAGGTTTLDGVIIAQTTVTTVIENAVSGDGDDTLLGNSVANELHGMRGNDTLDGGLGADTLWGGTGNDLFIFYFGDGADWIGDFTAGAVTDDVIALYGFGALNFGSLSLFDLGDDVRIDLGGGDEIVLAGVSSTTDLHEDDFMFFA